MVVVDIEPRCWIYSLIDCAAACAAALSFLAILEVWVRR